MVWSFVVTTRAPRTSRKTVRQFGVAKLDFYPKFAQWHAIHTSTEQKPNITKQAQSNGTQTGR